jgi:hypothetical protein
MNGEQLKRTLEAAKPELEAGLAAAEAELAEVDARRAELLALIERARAALAYPSMSSEVESRDRGMTLHEALSRVLSDHGNEWMTVQELAAEVNERGLYQKRDGSRIEPNQVHARAKNYTSLFEKNGPRVRLREN